MQSNESDLLQIPQIGRALRNACNIRGTLKAPKLFQSARGGHNEDAVTPLELP